MLIVTRLHKLLGLTEAVIDPSKVLGYRLVHTSETCVYLLVEANYAGTCSKGSKRTNYIQLSRSCPAVVSGFLVLTANCNM